MPPTRQALAAMERTRAKLNTQNVPLNFNWTQGQYNFYRCPAKYKILVKGRRWGATLSAAMYIIQQMIKNMYKKDGYYVLWIDVLYFNISAYYMKYFAPLMGNLGLPQEAWEWREQKKQLRIGSSVLDMRSADRKESLEGFGYNLVFFNEAGWILRDRELWTMTVAPMTLERHADVIFSGTPKGIIDPKDPKKDCLFLELYNKGKSGDPHWKSFHFTTYDNPYITESDIELMKESIPASIWRQEIYGEFLNVSQEPIFYEKWFSIIPKLPAAGIVYKVMSLDTAFKTKKESDYSCCLVIFQTPNNYIIVDMINEKYEFPALLEATQNMWNKYRTDVVLIEDKASGQSLIQSLKANTTIPIHGILPDTDKYTRAAATTFLCQTGKIQLLEGHWNKEFLLQLLNFPCGSDDIVDAFSQALNHLRDWKGSSNSFMSAKLKEKHMAGVGPRIAINERLAGFASPLHLQDTMRGFR
jgi:phage uncharacterized protein (putative large terminase), C-terminal domain